VRVVPPLSEGAVHSMVNYSVEADCFWREMGAAGMIAAYISSDAEESIESATTLVATTLNL